MGRKVRDEGGGVLFHSLNQFAPYVTPHPSHASPESFWREFYFSPTNRFFRSLSHPILSYICPTSHRHFQDDTLVFISHDSAKRGADGPPTLLVHSSVPFGLKQLKV